MSWKNAHVRLPAVALLGAMLVAAPLNAQEAAAPGAPAVKGQTGKDETYALLFRNGTLDTVEDGIRYGREVKNTAMPEAAARDTGTISIAFEPPEGDTPRMARLSFVQDGRSKGIGSFPASVGNPVIMYFVESVIRDMAETAGGSPFYIRNRVKEALVESAQIETVEVMLDGAPVTAQAVTMRPFAGDPNIDRMKGFGDLALTVTMSEEVPGWYYSLDARTAPRDGAGSETDYRSVMTFAGSDAAGAR